MSTALDNRSTTTAPATAVLPRGVTSLHRLRQVLLSMVIGMRQMLVGYWIVMVVAFLAVSLIIQLATGTVDHSVWDYGTQSPKYFSMALGITLTPAYFPLLVAQGVTRRMFSVAAGIYLTLAAVATAVLWVAAYQIEHLLYSWQDWPETFTNPHLFTTTSQVGLVFAEFFLLILSHEVAGWLLGITFVRFGFWRGVLLLPLAVIPAAAAEFFLIAQWLADPLSSIGYQRPPLAVAVPSILAVAALGLYAGYLVVRPLALKPAKG
ncbi:hypothetical protein E0H75_39070 [Kribbella capetownensis]|uniref:Uncharacterized protein n=1 Tax=Kribbella capetownensis TaxID=1572659 RepID=A0A4R0J0X2_9ACTN|nr:hypothetical protein [Kribbella capetownensis]TCC40073.1 hypothetical protein E0H75_39070 [Kribbella capetownensis]